MEFDAFFDWQNWLVGAYFELEGVVMQEPFGRYQVFALSLGPLILVAARRI